MAILAVPGLIALVSHSSGGAMLSTSIGGYVAGTLIPASMVTAAPLIGAVAITAVAVGVGAYLCLHGVPSVFADVLIQKGAATATTATEAVFEATAPTLASTAATIFVPSATTASILVPLACVAAVLAALAAVGYYAYTHSEAVKETVDGLARKARSATAEQVDALQATDLVDDFKAAFTKFIEGSTQLASDAASLVKDKAKVVSDSVSQFAESASAGIATKLEEAKVAANKVAKHFE